MQTAESLFAGPDNGNQNNVARHGGADQWLASAGTHWQKIRYLYK